MRQNISLAKIALLAAYSYGYHGKSEKNKRKREEKLRKRKESEEKQEKRRRKREKRRRKREKKGRKALRPVFLAEDKAERLWFGGARARPLAACLLRHFGLGLLHVLVLGARLLLGQHHHLENEVGNPLLREAQALVVLTDAQHGLKSLRLKISETVFSVIV